MEMIMKYIMHHDEAASVITPIIGNSVSPTGDNIEIHKLQKTIGELLYIANCTHPDISIAVNFIPGNL
eukprot:snap_masked-scaffold_99-processed-gene-0.7-mRNA-1 protein AED:1.00 eAED:1.00 QI:0/-1/0/0/-1/1/1/0/67